jgi:uncharacterized membrane protein YeaQ/YmgE (transglycosylase-associated protein family)
MNFLAWIVVGLIAGWLAGQVMKGGGYGVLVDIILGILGGFLGGWIFGLLGIGGRWRDDWVHHCGICWCCDFSRDYPPGKTGLTSTDSLRLPAKNPPPPIAVPRANAISI